ncbi:MAG: hypothetical protein GC202_02085 [Alphaproteobacteria bacterium]|nr:hypothetical protein [Alphaproteobacteria bacterium]
MLKLTIPPAAEPVSLTEAKAHLRVDGSADDALIAAYVGAARQYVESATQRQLVTATWELGLAAFPCADRGGTPPRIELQRPPLATVNSVKYDDADGVEQTLAVNVDYVLFTPGDSPTGPLPFIEPAFGRAWPTARAMTNSVRIRYDSGQAAASVPSALKAAILLIVGDLYANREGQFAGSGIVVAPNATVDALLWPFRIVAV